MKVAIFERDASGRESFTAILSDVSIDRASVMEAAKREVRRIRGASGMTYHVCRLEILGEFVHGSDKERP